MLAEIKGNCIFCKMPVHETQTFGRWDKYTKNVYSAEEWEYWHHKCYLFKKKERERRENILGVCNICNKSVTRQDLYYRQEKDNYIVHTYCYIDRKSKDLNSLK